MANIEADLSRWDIGYESAIVGPGKICSRCDYVSGEGEPIWYKGWMDTSPRGPIDAIVVYLCPGCQRELQVYWHEKLLAQRLEDAQRRHATRSYLGWLHYHKHKQEKLIQERRDAEPIYEQETLL